MKYYERTNQRVIEIQFEIIDTLKEDILNLKTKKDIDFYLKLLESNINDLNNYIVEV